ncbi:MAG: 16S rRNA (guanine(527)-N(7))-methyltransferase RsmG [Nitrospira sp.]|nr:16S rRNA (guanine(527)-N(7))-methyltransferase RsmG [Nitrospira sp.]MEB2338268.1 16S rRNA (guanine(527)-N(7))-methyltransferase RsmG [Nitrospirales bacterium]QOJ35159.1 MAG: 16S rRNA (guanine(527)-N(7))-methyltransferase RsmG [Nitrospira sp.]
MEHRSSRLRQHLKRFSDELFLPIPESSFDLFERYYHALREWNRAINLTAIESEEEVAAKHFVDSVAGMKVIENAGLKCVLDVGSGAGFPALPLKFALPQLVVELLEPSEKRSAFLRYVIGLLGLSSVRVCSFKLDEYANRQPQRKFDYIVVRALRVDDAGNALSSLLRDGGKVILYRSSKVEADFRLNDLALDSEVEYELPAGYGHRVLSIFARPGLRR